MESYDLNSFPELLKSGILTQQEAVNKICSFMVNNYRVFNLQKYDEDFRSDLIISFLENGIKFLNSYKPEIGDFFTFLYCYINSMVTTRIRALTQKTLKENVTLAEGINIIPEKEYKYSKITYQVSEIPKAPYSYKPTNVEELKKIFSKLNDDNTDKKILVLAMKSSYYLSDTQISKISSMYNLKKDDFYKAIQYFKDTLIDKSEKRAKAEERRNFAYYHHKKYNMQIENLSKSDNNNVRILQQELSFKQNKHKKNWQKMNKKLEEGYLYLRPTTKSIADVLGICERQVTYYINCAKKDVEENKVNLKTDFE